MNSSKDILFLGTDTKISQIDKNYKKIVVFELEKEKILRERGIDVIYFNRQAQSEKVWNDILVTAERWYNEWPNKNLNNGKSILEILKFDDTSLWWFVYDILWESKNGIFDTIYQIVTLTSLIEEYNPEQISIVGKFEFPIFEMISSIKKEHKYKTINQSKISKGSKKNRRVISKKRINIILRILFLKIVKTFSKNQKGKIAIFSVYGGVINKTRTGEKLAADKYFMGLEEFIEEKRNNIIFVSINKNFDSKFNKIISDTFFGRYTPWVVHYSLNGIWKAYTEIKNLKKFLLTIENDENFIESMTIKNINIFPFLREEFLKILPLLVGIAHLELDATRKFLSQNSDIETVFTTDGFGPAGRALNYICKKNLKRVITPQLGIIAAEFPVNTAFLIRKDYDLRLLPEYLVWGDYFRKLIEERGYPKKLMKSVGFWKTNPEKRIEKTDEFIFYVGGANRIKLEYVSSVEEEIFAIRRIHEVLPKDLRLVVKLRPGLDEELYFEALGDLKNIRLIGNKEAVDVNELVTNSKIVIGKASTLLIQAMILNKAVIAVNFAGNVNFLGIDRVPFVTNVEKFEEIMNHIMNENYSNPYPISDICDSVGNEAIENVKKALMNS